MPAARLPSQFGRYRIERLLGEGGMGSVYLAHDTQLDRKVALKVPHFSEGKGPQIIARFYQEARAAATVHHPHVCPVYDVGEIDGTHYLTMAFVEGKPLESWVEADRALTLRQIATLGRKIADALGEAHKKGVIHRDLKPANIMIDKRGEPVVMDFGLARRSTTADDKRLTQAGTILGSPAYMSPEQIRGDTETTGPSTDIFSLGVILYELIARRLPFDGATIAAVQVQILTQPPPPLRDSRPDLDASLEAICMKALEKKTEDRFRTMGEMAAALKGYLEGKAPGATATPHPAAPPPPPPHSGIHASAFGGRSLVVAEREEDERKHLAKRSGSDRPRKKKKASRSAAPRTGVLVAGGGAAFAAVMGLGLLLWPHKKPETAADTPVGLTTDPPSGPAPTPAPRVPEPGFVSLFDGKDLAGWVVHSGDPAVWKAEHSELGFHVNNPAAQKGWLVTDRMYGEFSLRLEFQLSAGANSGVAVRVRRNEPPAQWLTVNIEDNTSPRYAQDPLHAWTGGVFGVHLDHKADLRPLGEWNTMEVTLLGNSLLAMVNGKETTRVELDDPAVVKHLGHKPDDTGRIALNAEEGSVRFRNIEIKEFQAAARPVAKVEPPAPKVEPPAPRPPVVQIPPEPQAPPGAVFRPMFDGKSLNGWQPTGVIRNSSWKAVNKELVATTLTPPGRVAVENWVVTTREYGDYILRLEFRADANSLGGVSPHMTPKDKVPPLIPAMDDDSPVWKQVGLANNPAFLRTGGLAWLTTERPADLKPRGQWNAMEVKVRWPWIWVSVNGKTTVRHLMADSRTRAGSEEKFAPAGRIGLLSWFGTVRYRNIEMLELPTVLFNGKDLTGWKNEGNPQRATWRAENGELVAATNQKINPKAKTSFRDEIRTEKEYSDYRLTFEFQAEQGALAYVAPRWKKFDFDFLVPIADDGFAPFQPLLGPTKGTGGLMPFLIHRKAELKPPGRWNEMELVMKWPNLEVRVNDERTFDSRLIPNFLALISKVRNGQEFPKSSPIGVIASFGTVRFRKMEVVPITDH